MDETKLKIYQAELGNAMGHLKSVLADAQTSIGVIESFLYLIRKESMEVKLPEGLKVVEPSTNGTEHKE